MMIANTFISMGGKKYKPGDIVDGNLSEADKDFLISNNYVEITDNIPKDKMSESDKEKKNVTLLKNGSEKKAVVDTKGDQHEFC